MKKEKAFYSLMGIGDTPPPQLTATKTGKLVLTSRREEKIETVRREVDITTLECTVCSFCRMVLE